MLADALRRQPLGPQTRVLDLCTGSGALAVTAAKAGAGEVVAADVSRRALLTVRCNAALNGVRIRTVRGDLFDAVGDDRFDVIVSNPPYVPDASGELPTGGARRAWDAGSDGRAFLDRVCGDAADHLLPGGTILLVHSSVCDQERTLRMLCERGLRVAVLSRRRGPLGPLLSARAPDLEAEGLLAPGERTEEVLVVAGRA